MTVFENDDIKIVRNPNAGKHNLSILKDIYVEFGDRNDWEIFSELHYKGKNLAAGSRFVRCVHEDNGVKIPIGVMVFANPTPLNKGRSDVFPHLRQNQGGSKDTTLINKHRMRWINTYMTWNNRTVLDTMYRSAGIAYRFKNLAYRMYCAKHGFKFVESSSSMGKFNRFSIKAGMKFIKPRPNAAFKHGVNFFKTYFKSHPCDQVALIEEFNSMEPATAKLVERKLREFYFRHSAIEKTGDKMHNGMTRIDKLTVEKIIKEIIQLVFGWTIYWVFENPDFGRKDIPDRLPLLAFDNQRVNEPLDLKKVILQ